MPAAYAEPLDPAGRFPDNALPGASATLSASSWGSVGPSNGLVAQLTSRRRVQPPSYADRSALVVGRLFVGVFVSQCCC